MEERKNKISDILGMNPFDTATTVIADSFDEKAKEMSAPEVVVDDTRKDEDFDEARLALKNLVQLSADAAEKMAEIAEQSQNVQAYEKLGAVINSAVQASKALMDIHKTKKAIDKTEAENPSLKEPTAGDTHNHLYVGSTADLQAMIAQMHKKEE